ncbi:hypothetical protein TNCV_42761 [Trichonephila clavipes]|nr:hypothetical protein TNCV_42761 [Trichonephila clavipes]
MQAILISGMPKILPRIPSMTRVPLHVLEIDSFMEMWCNIVKKEGGRRAVEVGCGSPVVKVSDPGRHAMRSSPVPLKTRRRRGEMLRHPPVGVVVRRLRCRPRHLTMVQNDDVRRLV